MKVNVVIYGNKAQGYSCITKEEFPHCVLAGYGDTEEECKQDLLLTVHEMKEIGLEEGWTLPELDFSYSYAS